eukprot:6413616-Prymnesium_polylepis.1
MVENVERPHLDDGLLGGSHTHVRRYSTPGRPLKCVPVAGSVRCRVIALAPVLAARCMPGYGPTKRR